MDASLWELIQYHTLWRGYIHTLACGVEWVPTTLETCTTETAFTAGVECTALEGLLMTCGLGQCGHSVPTSHLPSRSKGPDQSFSAELPRILSVNRQRHQEIQVLLPQQHYIWSRYYQIRWCLEPKWTVSAVQWLSLAPFCPLHYDPDPIIGHRGHRSVTVHERGNPGISALFWGSVRSCNRFPSWLPKHRWGPREPLVSEQAQLSLS